MIDRALTHRLATLLARGQRRQKGDGTWHLGDSVWQQCWYEYDVRFARSCTERCAAITEALTQAATALDMSVDDLRAGKPLPAQARQTSLWEEVS